MVFKKLNLNLNHLNDQKFVLYNLRLRGVNNPFNSFSDGCNPHLNVPILIWLLTIPIIKLSKPTIRIALELLKIKCITIDKYMDQFDVNINFIELALHRP